MVPLSTLGLLKPHRRSETVPHYNNYASALVNGGAAPGYSSGQAVLRRWSGRCDRATARFRIRMDRHYLSGTEGGIARTVVFVLAIVFVFLILAAQYESWSMPFYGVVRGTAGAVRCVPGALRARPADRRLFSDRFRHADWPFRQETRFDREFAKRRRQEGLTIVDAAMEAARLRLRPILMTAFAFILGVVP